MAIIITGDLKFVGYKQNARPGLNRQVLTYRDGDATWENLAAENLVTSPSSEDVIIDNDGNVVVSELDTYSGIDSKPIKQDPLGQPSLFVKTTTIDQGLSVTFVDQSNISTTFIPAAQQIVISGGAISFVENATIPFPFDGGTI